MGFQLDKLVKIESCFALPLRYGVLMVSLVGLILGAFHGFAYTDPGSEWMVQVGIPTSIAYSTSAKRIHYTLAVLLVATHLLIFGAVLYKTPYICELYSWTAVILGAGIFVLGASAAVAILIKGGGWNAGAFGLTSTFLSLVMFSCGVIAANYRMTLP